MWTAATPFRTITHAVPLSASWLARQKRLFAGGYPLPTSPRRFCGKKPGLFVHRCPHGGRSGDVRGTTGLFPTRPLRPRVTEALFADHTTLSTRLSTQWNMCSHACFVPLCTQLCPAAVASLFQFVKWSGVGRLFACSAGRTGFVHRLAFGLRVDLAGSARALSTVCTTRVRRRAGGLIRKNAALRGEERRRKDRGPGSASRFAQQAKHLLLVRLDAGLVERVDTQQIAAHADRVLEEIDRLA